MIATIFPLLGIMAFLLLWIHSMMGVFEPWLRPRMPFDAFVHYTALIILFCIVLHPLLLLILIEFNFALLFSGNPLAISLGVAGFLLLITYDIGKALKRREFFTRHWNTILLISTIGFILTFFHSLMLGSHLQSGPLRALWIFFGTTAILATIYTYGVKRLRYNQNNEKRF
ncbi:MAG: hypothetical protein UX71_C0005G0009 [Parcubacteria group bacterium GW2011_GWA1_47_10]|uniref:Ferric oxidoreductase domain-containing protein n=1 Tax=Candidatus Zambryskibacteria bacterium RIFCSPHIGHO2_01_FULL_46_25 TaxID=1802738 RepID=A0A1G2SZ69_9BACT|nr:MAG: hypothetical protein UX71_C0005G0009 [Parcubacteria group bacterium GW2011_GWA1_47_10]OHA90340.1 MAG: hypothetical protein A2838_01935 [Candidatus Zambryskibacteria bacterium RIFCSPHIGHO2_01_FULL_46_25]OHB06881.1 MAG: hypothetical protein A3A31_01085 [Candidatus Zambryskibacteria bacterium RIFCSPLOWO2_01_FULL_48_25]